MTQFTDPMQWHTDWLLEKLEPFEYVRCEPTTKVDDPRRFVCNLMNRQAHTLTIWGYGRTARDAVWAALQERERKEAQATNLKGA